MLHEYYCYTVPSEIGVEIKYKAMYYIPFSTLKFFLLPYAKYIKQNDRKYQWNMDKELYQTW